MRFNQKGQTVLPEYVVAFFLAITAIVTITVYVQRALQARVRDAKIHMIDIARAECDEKCQRAIGANEHAYMVELQEWRKDRLEAIARGDKVPPPPVPPKKNISYEYEPYYGQVNAVTTRDTSERTGLLEGLQTGIFRKVSSEAMEVDSKSVQLPPKDTN